MGVKDRSIMKIWAHRGCSQCYPENTITAFEKAMNIPGLSGIELDIQHTRDREMVVIHDERVDRTTDGIGFVRDMSLKEIRSLHIHNNFDQAEKIPTIIEVIELLMPRLKEGLRLNIELKNGKYPYPGMEENIVKLVHQYGVEDAVLYSTFYADSLFRVHKLDPEAELGVLDSRVSDCLYKARGLESILDMQSIALHPNGGAIDIVANRLAGRNVRAWFGGHLYPEKPTGGKMDLERLELMGVTDVFLNEPEKYLNN